MESKVAVDLVLSLKEKVETLASRPDGYENLKTFVKMNSGKTLHPNHGLITYALMKVAGFAGNGIRKSVAKHLQSGFKYDLHKKHLEDFDNFIERLDLLNVGRTEMYGFMKFWQTLMRMRKMAERIVRNEIGGQDELDTELKIILTYVAVPLT